ncbi:MAG: hypothetical protein OSB15_11615 [Amylibacter sp.]|nr:hypothetical protein [Amylibacter sp.]
MIIFELLSWDAFGSGWFWLLLLIQWFSHSLWVLGIPVDMLRDDDPATMDLIIYWRTSRLIKFVEGLNFVLVIAVSATICGIVVLGFWYKIEASLAICLLVLPEFVILWVSYKTAIMLKKSYNENLDNKNIINRLHNKIHVVGGVTILMAGIFGYSYEILL